MSRRAWSWFLLILLAGTPLYFAAGGALQRIVFYVYGFGSVAATLVGVRVHRPARPWPWLAFAAGLFLFAVGDIAFDLYDAVGKTPPVPSVADCLYLGAYPVLAWGMVLFVRQRVRGADVASALDGAMVALGVGVIAWVFVMAPYAHDRTLRLGEQIVPIAYPALDLLLIAVLVRLLLGHGVRNPSFRLLAASVVSLLVADGFYAFATVHNTYRDGSLIDLGWLLSYALWGAAALHPTMPHLAEPSSRSTSSWSHLTVVLLGLAAVTSPATLIVQGTRGGTTDEVLLAASSVVMFAMVLARLSLATRALDASNGALRLAVDRQLSLTASAVAFVGAGDVASVDEAAVRTVVELAAGDESWACFVAMRPAGPTVVAAAGPAPYAVGVLAPSELAVDWYDRGRAGAPQLLRDCDERPRSSRSYVAPVVAGDHMRGKIVVGDGAEAFLPTLAIVCSQMGLALESIQAAEERLRARDERKFGSLVQHSSDVVTLIDRDGVVAYQSPAVRTMLGRRSDELVGQRVGNVIHPDDATAVSAQLTKVLTAGPGATAEVACRVSHADGSWRELDTVMTNLLDDPDVEAIVLNSRDVTDRRALERTLNRQAFHDTLTGLANRALFFDRVDHALKRAGRQAGPIAVLFLDVDDFKVVNDSLGHPAGDDLLVAVAQRLTASVRPGDTVARFGGDEFAVLVEYGDMPEAAQAVAERIADALREPVRLGTEDVTVRVSVGITLGQPPDDLPDDLFRDADLAMYMAKRNGKGRFEMFRPAMHEEAIRRLETAAGLRRGIERNEFEVFYQPIVNIGTGAPIGVEALVRWHHPSRGLVPPVEFIAVAESTGLIVPLGKWVLSRACEQAASWRRAGIVDDDFYVSVNVSARQLQDPALLDTVVGAIREANLSARALLLEVTESVLMEDLDSGLARLLALKELGVRLAVDDFGTGYSSLSYLRDLPIDVVKIDKSFIDKMAHNPQGAALVRGVIDMSAALGLTTIAEGVEQDDQLELLHRLGCHNVQGYLFAAPTSSNHSGDLLTRLQTSVRPETPTALERT